MTKLKLIIQWGLLVLVVLMPFHAFFSVWLGHLTGHQALIQAWKEVLLLTLSALAIPLVVREADTRSRLKSWPVYLGAAFAGISLLVSAATQPGLTAIAFGVKTDLEFLAALVLGIVVSDRHFVRRLVRALLGAASVVVAFGLLQITVLPADFLVRFGYGPGTVPPYLVLDPAVKSLRFASTLGGPNQLGTYLMLPLALAAIIAVRRRRWWLLVLVAAGLFVIISTYSRSAWLGAIAAAVSVTLMLTPARLRLAAVAGLGVIGAAAAFALTHLLKLGGNLQYYLLHSSSLWHGARGSDYEHLNSLRDGLNLSLSQPFGHGLGTAGPATFHSTTNLIIENNFLQLAYETGLPGVIAYLALLAACGWLLARQVGQSDLAAASLAAVIGICVTALVLPAWTDSTTALVVWTTVGAALGAGESARV